MEGSDTNLSSSVHSTCLWYSNYSVSPSQLECILSYCDAPTEDPNTSGKNYDFHWDGELVPLEADIVYPCKADMKIEDKAETKEAASNISIVRCSSSGDFLYPSVWAQCSHIVDCGQPPHKTQNGIRTWQGSEFKDNYGTQVEYSCENGSQFDTDNDGFGDSLQLTVSCLWSKVWSPWSNLPPCVVTHCIFLLPVPSDSFLEEVTSDWTPVETEKQFRCQGMNSTGMHTRFTEADRTVSTFSISCQENGQFTFENKRQNWPTCLEGTY